MPKLIRLYIRQILIGFVVSAAFVAMLLFTNVGNLWHLVSNTSGGVVAVLMLWVFNGIVFAGVQFGISIMRMARDEDGEGGGRRDALPVLQPDAVAVPVRADARRTRLDRQMRR